MEKDIKYLKKHYGSHRAVAKILGIHETHYRKVRNLDKGSHILKELIHMKANDIRIKSITK
jgi:hypothetical protein